jgi:hypothetical protein
MEEGYDAINLDRCKALLAGEPLARLPDAAFRLSRRAAASAPADDDVDRRGTAGRDPKAGRDSKARGVRRPPRAAHVATSPRRRS